MKPETHFPLPTKQYHRYAIFWSALTLGSLAGALGWTLWQARTALGWQEIVTALLLLAQMATYRMLLGRTLLPSQRQLIVYFGVNLAIWSVEILLVPGIWWIVFAYIGQMFGLLSAKIALLMTLYIAIVVFGFSIDWSLKEIDLEQLFAMAVQWTTIIVFFMFINRLIQTSRERGRLIAELEAAKRELEAAQQRETELAVLRERSRLARDLHDSLGHALVALSVQLEAVQRLYHVDPERASIQVDEMKALTRASMDSLRRSVAGLRAPGLGDSTLPIALQAVCVDFGQRTGINVDCRVDKETDALSPALAETLWRVAQEALTNIEKHAQAHQVLVHLNRKPYAVSLRVTDDGIGLPEQAEASPNHFGLRGMRERVEGLGGVLLLQGDENGTIIEASLPVIIADQPTAADGETTSER